MKISKMIINNFRCFYGLQVPIEFDTNGKITLIYGLSGSGKTTMLDFLNWTFYGVEPKDKNSTRQNKPLYNKKSMEELNPNSELTVSGIITFTHKNMEYKLIREQKFKKTYVDIKGFPQEVRLYYRALKDYSGDDNIGFVPYDKDLKQKINEIVPQSLSKYFFFAGEDGGALATEDVNLASSIYSMFDLKKYDEAIRHLGERTNRNSLIGKYSKEKADYKAKGVSGDAKTIYDKMIKYADYRRTYEKMYNDYEGYIKKYEDNLKNLYKEAGTIGGNAAERIKRNIEANKNSINSQLTLIQNHKNDIGRNMAATLPYILLSNKAVEVRNSLAIEVQKDNERRKQIDSFVDLGRPLLEDIKKKGKCVCGKQLDDEAINYINDTLRLLPPSSYALIFNQFVDTNKNKIYGAEAKYQNVLNEFAECVKCYSTIEKLSEDNKQLLEELGKLDETRAKEIANQISHIEEKLREYKSKQRMYYEEMEKGRRGENKFASDYDKITKNQGIRNDLDDKIEMLNTLKNSLQVTFEHKKKEVKEQLEENIKEVYGLLSTRVEDFHNKDFLKLNFSLRDEYKTGGQELIDVYSYVIGMIKALGKTGNEDSEFPVIVDAPFSKTDEIQLAHVIETMPKIVSQVAFFTFDKSRIKEFADVTAIGTVWELSSDETQEVTVVSRGEL